MCNGWCHDEVVAGRRLVAFHKIQAGKRLLISCEPILPDDYAGESNVISCIYRPDTGTHCVTSIDIIALLEFCTDGVFPIKEKNRIRRNIEGLKPNTVKKDARGRSSFFQRIMDFPDPKPRHIEKSLKIFQWSVLPRALEIVLSKYVSGHIHHSTLLAHC
jgi:hypothetical protein